MVARGFRVRIQNAGSRPAPTWVDRSLSMALVSGLVHWGYPESRFQHLFEVVEFHLAFK